MGVKAAADVAPWERSNLNSLSISAMASNTRSGVRPEQAQQNESPAQSSRDESPQLPPSPCPNRSLRVKLTKHEPHHPTQNQGRGIFIIIHVQ